MERLEIDNITKETTSKIIQGRWTRWPSIIHNDIKWNTLINNSNDKLIKFHLNATLETLTSRDNLRRWGVEINGSCTLCGLPETLKHTLCVCSVARVQGRYKWRHNTILCSLFQSIKLWYNSIETKLGKKPSQSFINFVGYNSVPGHKPTRKFVVNGILNATGWKFYADIKDSESIQSALSEVLPAYSNEYIPDWLALNFEKRQIIIGELTSPWEENIPGSDARKLQKYTPLASALTTNGYQVHLFTFSNGAPGYVSSSFDVFLHKIGMPRASIKLANRKVASVVNYCSFILFCHKDIQIWNNLSSASFLT